MSIIDNEEQSLFITKIRVGLMFLMLAFFMYSMKYSLKTRYKNEIITHTVIEEVVNEIEVSTIVINDRFAQTLNLIRDEMNKSHMKNIDINFLMTIAILESSLNTNAINHADRKYGLFQLTEEDILVYLDGDVRITEVLKDFSIGELLLYPDMNTTLFITKLESIKGRTYGDKLRGLGKSEAYINRFSEVYYMMSGNPASRLLNSRYTS